MGLVKRLTHCALANQRRRTETDQRKKAIKPMRKAKKKMLPGKSVDGAEGGMVYFTSRLRTDALQEANDAPPRVPRSATSLHSDNAVFFFPPARPRGNSGRHPHTPRLPRASIHLSRLR